MRYDFDKKDLCDLIDAEKIYYGRGRSETGECLHLPLKRGEANTQMAGAALGEDCALMLTVANNLVEYLMQKREIKTPETWDYDPEKCEIYVVCGDNPTTSGIVIKDKFSDLGSKIQIMLDKTFGSNEIAIKWRNDLVGDEALLGDYQKYLENALKSGELAIPKEKDDGQSTGAACNNVMERYMQARR